MKLDTYKTLACKLLGTVSVLFLFGLFAAVVEGSCPWDVALFFGILCLVILNSVCGALLPSVKEAEPTAQPASAPLRAVRGGNAA